MTATPVHSRPQIQGTRHVVSCGNFLAARVANAILDAGGNAVDAGVAAGIALGVVESEMVGFAGVAPIMVRMAGGTEVITIAGLGWWPKLATEGMYADTGAIPDGLGRTVVPAALDAWLTALENYGTMSFADVAAGAADLAANGFAMYPFMSEVIGMFAADHARWESNAAIYLPGGKPPEPGSLFVQSDLGATIRYLIDQEKAHAKGDRRRGLQAVRDAFYKGDIARTIVAYHEANGGLLRMDDLADYSSAIERAVGRKFGDAQVYTCPPWCQGPVLLQMLAMVDRTAVAAMGHNSADYVHHLAETIKLAFADRHAFYGDPDFIDVPVERLMSDAYAAERRQMIDRAKAAPEMPAPGAALGTAPEPPVPEPSVAAGRSLDTSYVAVIDKWGNAFSATPSDISNDTPVIPGLGIAVSSRGSQSWASASHPCSIAPGKRPRLTPSPALVSYADGSVMAFGTPGGDVQLQSLLQVFLAIELFGMEPQPAVEAPRFASYSFPDSFEPHNYLPGRLAIEKRLADRIGEDLADRGHDLQIWPDYPWRAGAVCIARRDGASGRLTAAADPRRPAYAIGW